MPDVLMYILIASLSFSFTLKHPDLEGKLYRHYSYGENKFIYGIFVDLGGELFAMAVGNYGLIVCIKPPKGFYFVLTCWSTFLLPSLPWVITLKQEHFQTKWKKWRVINKLVKWKPHKIDTDRINICCSWCNKLDSPTLIILSLN